MLGTNSCSKSQNSGTSFNLAQKTECDVAPLLSGRHCLCLLGIVRHYL
jgi:hypothetical protein